MTLFCPAFGWAYFFRKWSILNGRHRPVKNTIIQQCIKLQFSRTTSLLLAPNDFSKSSLPKKLGIGCNLAFRTLAKYR